MPNDTTKEELTQEGQNDAETQLIQYLQELESRIEVLENKENDENEDEYE